METRIKERLVGAIALVAIVVIVVPEVLTGPRTPAPSKATPAAAPVRTVSIDLAAGERGAIARPPAPAAGPVEAAGVATPVAAAPLQGAAGAPAGMSVAAQPLHVAAPGGAAHQPASGTPPAAQARQTAQAPPAAATPAVPAPASVAPPATTQPPRPAVPGAGAEGWVVQLGSFASKDNAEGLAKSLRAKGYRAFVSEFRGSGRILFRVRVGPEQDRARADAIAARLASEGHRGSVAPQP
jgi:DedD protein